MFVMNTGELEFAVTQTWDENISYKNLEKFVK